jgi:hypothetical protein
MIPKVLGQHKAPLPAAPGTAVLVKALRRIGRNPLAALGRAAVERLASLGWLTPWERRFLLDTGRRAPLTAMQAEKTAQINAALLRRAAREEGRRRA